MFFVLGLLLIFTDQITKYLVYSKGLGNFLLRLRPVFSRQIFPNPDFAFSLHLPHWLIYLVYIFLLGWLCVWFLRLENKSTRAKLAFCLIVSGALSNIFDRLALGYVRDFIYIFWGNIFNLADLYILAGVLLLLF